MEDIFIEHLVKRKKSKKDIAAIIFSIASGVIFTPMALYYGIILQYLGYVFLIAVFALWWCIIRIIKSKNVEYEYIFTSGTFEIDMILGGGKRGNLIKIERTEIELFAPISVPFNEPFKTLNCSSRDENDDLYYIITQRHGVGTVRVLFNPTKELVDAFKLYRPSKVITGDENNA